MPETLSDRPAVVDLEAFLQRVLAERNDLEFVVLFGSMARGNWSLHSDYDILVGLSQDDGLRLIDRMTQFDALAHGNLEIFPYARSEWQRLAGQYHPLLLDTLDHGIVLFDRGSFALLRERFRIWKDTGVVIPLERGWRVNPPVDAVPADW